MKRAPFGLELTGIEKSLCWIQTKHRDKDIPLTEGYFFNDYPTGTGKVYRGDSLSGPVEEVADFGDIFVEKNVVAVSPQHGTIITGAFDIVPGKGLNIYEDGRYSLLNIEGTPIQAWLYNSGIEFFTDNKGEEFCLFGEFSHLPSNSRRLFKGHYPYSDIYNWKVVGTQEENRKSDGILTSYYQIRKDPWSDYIYCTTGPNPEDTKVYYSSDDGETWDLLLHDMPAGCLKMINFIFLEDAIWWASDEMPHFLMNAQRNSEGLLDVNSIRIVTHLPYAQASNAMAYNKEFDSLFFYDRIYDNSGLKLQICAYNLRVQRLFRVDDLNSKSDVDNPWGFRGKCYQFYPAPTEKSLAMGAVSECIYCKLGNPFDGLRSNRESTLCLHFDSKFNQCKVNSLKDCYERVRWNIRTKTVDLYTPTLIMGDKPFLRYSLGARVVQNMLEMARIAKGILGKIKKIIIK